jgi:hypothetical protein
MRYEAFVKIASGIAVYCAEFVEEAAAGNTPDE